MGAGREVQISLDGVRDKNLMQLKKLNTALFPVRYNDKYYADALASGEFTKLGSIMLLGLAHFCIIFLLHCVFCVMPMVFSIIFVENSMISFCFGVLSCFYSDSIWIPWLCFSVELDRIFTGFYFLAYCWHVGFASYTPLMLAIVVFVCTWTVIYSNSA